MTQDDVVQIENPQKLGVDQIPVERVSLGRRGDYKPCVARLAGGELLLICYRNDSELPGDQTHSETLLFRSCDGGRTWTGEPILGDMPNCVGEPYLSVLSDGTVFVTGGVGDTDRDNPKGYGYACLCRSTDGGRTWEATEITGKDVPGAADEDPIVTDRNVLELQDGSVILGVGAAHDHEYIWRSYDRGKTWDKTLKCHYDGVDMATYPYQILAEAHYRQAPCGDLLAVCRIDQKFFPALPGTEIPQTTSDHYDRMVVYRSKDGGANWAVEEFGAHYGEMYPSILRLQDGRLLFTFTLRAAEPPQKPPLGVRAVVGKETQEGFEFDFKHDRIMLDAKTPIGQYSGGGFGPTVQLDDGTLVTSYSYNGPGEWGEDVHAEVVRWHLP